MRSLRRGNTGQQRAALLLPAERRDDLLEIEDDEHLPTKVLVASRPVARIVVPDRERLAWTLLESFPTGAHDDQVDVLSDLIAELTLGGSGTVGVHVVG